MREWRDREHCGVALSPWVSPRPMDSWLQTLFSCRRQEDQSQECGKAENRSRKAQAKGRILSVTGAGKMQRSQQELPEPGKAQSERQEVKLLGSVPRLRDPSFHGSLRPWHSCPGLLTGLLLTLCGSPLDCALLADIDFCFII